MYMLGLCWTHTGEPGIAGFPLTVLLYTSCLTVSNQVLLRQEKGWPWRKRSGWKVHSTRGKFCGEFCTTLMVIWWWICVWNRRSSGLSPAVNAAVRTAIVSHAVSHASNSSTIHKSIISIRAPCTTFWWPRERYLEVVISYFLIGLVRFMTINNNTLDLIVFIQHQLVKRKKSK